MEFLYQQSHITIFHFWKIWIPRNHTKFHHKIKDWPKVLGLYRKLIENPKTNSLLKFLILYLLDSFCLYTFLVPLQEQFLMVSSILLLAYPLRILEDFMDHYKEMFHWLEIQNLQKVHHSLRIFQ